MRMPFLSLSLSHNLSLPFPFVVSFFPSASHTQKRVEVPYSVTVERFVELPPRTVERVVEVPVERFVEKVLERIIEVPVTRYVDRTVEACARACVCV